MIVEKPLPRSHGISSSKRKSRDKFNPNPLNKHFSEQLKIPHGSFCYPINMQRLSIYNISYQLNVTINKCMMLIIRLMG